MILRTTRDFEMQELAMDIRCRHCGRCVTVWHNLIKRLFPRPIPVDRAQQRLKCSHCGHRCATIEVYDPPPRPGYTA